MTTNSPAHAAAESQPGVISNQKYDLLKHGIQLFIPALGTLYFALASIWGLPYANEVLGSLAAAGTFLGVIVTFLSRSWAGSDAEADGVIDVHEDETGKKIFTLNLNGDPQTLDQQSKVVFKVNPPK